MSDFDMSDLRRRKDAVTESVDSDDVWHEDIMVLMVDLQNGLARRLRQAVSSAEQMLASRLPDGVSCDLRVFAAPPDMSGERDSISVYVSVSLTRQDAGVQEIPVDISVAKLSDHCENPNNILFWIDVDKYIKVRGNGGFSCTWNSLVLDPQKYDLMNFRQTPQSMDPENPDIPAGGAMMIVGAEFSISENDKRNVISRAARGTMKNVHGKIKEIVN